MIFSVSLWFPFQHGQFRGAHCIRVKLAKFPRASATEVWGGLIPEDGRRLVSADEVGLRKKNHEKKDIIQMWWEILLERL